VQALTVAAAFGFQVLIPQYMQRVLGYGAAGAGTGMLPAAVMIGALSAGPLGPADRAFSGCGRC